jgi:hypothetical protein
MMRRIIKVELEDTSVKASQLTVTMHCGHTWMDWFPTRSLLGTQYDCPFCPADLDCNACNHQHGYHFEQFNGDKQGCNETDNEYQTQCACNGCECVDCTTEKNGGSYYHAS